MIDPLSLQQRADTRMLSLSGGETRRVDLACTRQQHVSLPTEIREQVDARIKQLLENLRFSVAGYDDPPDQWTTIYGDGAGLILCAVVQEQQRLIILRLV